ncbi:hypothetical protein GF406_16465 [candidate division KSB1 bacterium]|nr:hypothetical protein [candidate division KSB1 bacterium]
MNCPKRAVLQDYIDGELSQDDNQSIIKHIQSCTKCKEQLRDIFVLQKTLSKVIQEDPCPPVEILEKYAKNIGSTETAGTIKEHIDLCANCRSYVWAFQATEEELAQWQSQEEQSFKEYLAQNQGFDAAKAVLLKLLPNKIELFDKWGLAILSWVSGLKDKALEQWPSLTSSPQLAGVLGFSEEIDHSTEAASIIMATTLYISESISDGSIEPTREAVEQEIRQIAPVLGAGTQLQERLIETIPGIVLKSL